MSTNNQTLRLEIGFKGQFGRTNEETGKTYKTRFFYVMPNNDPLAIEQYKADTLAAGHKIVIDDVTGLVLFRTTRFFPAGCDVIKTKSGDWIADTDIVDEIEALSKRYPSQAEKLQKKLDEKVERIGRKIKALKGTEESVETTEDSVDVDPFA